MAMKTQTLTPCLFSLGGRRAALAAAAVYVNLAWVPSAHAASPGHVLIRSFPFGRASGQLGYHRGDVRAYDEVAGLVAVSAEGTAYVNDVVNARMYLVRSDGSIDRVLERNTVSGYAGNNILPLLPNGYVAAYGSKSGTRTLKRYDDAGAVVQQADVFDFFFVAALANYHFLVRTGKDAGAGAGHVSFCEFDEHLQIAARYDVPPAALLTPGRSGVKGAVVLHLADRCLTLPESTISEWTPVVETPTGLRLMATNGPAELRPDGTLVWWDVPEGQVADPDFSGHPFQELLEDGNYEYVEMSVERALGLDGQFYSLLITADHYELVRLDLSGLSMTRVEPIPNSPPTMLVDGPTTVSASSGLRVWIRGHDTEPGTLTLTAANLPDGARFMQSRRGNKAALDWTPTSEQVGEHTIRVTVEDLMCGRTTQDLVVTVEE